MDLILTNISKYYQPSTERPPFALPDHASILNFNRIVIKSRNLRPSKRLAMDTYMYLESVDVEAMINVTERN